MTLLHMVGTALSFGVGLPTTAQTSEAIAARQAGTLPHTSYQIGQARKAMQGVMQAANDRAIAANPASATYVDISPAARKARPMETWDKQHAGLRRLTPKLYAERRKAYEWSIDGR